MKKDLFFVTTFVVFALLYGNELFAQDVIVTKNSEKIEAKITDVEQDCIKYKKYNYQEGPTYTILKADIASIIYQNGDVETFSNSNVANSYSSNSGSQQDGLISGYCSKVFIKSRSLFAGNGSKFEGFVIGDNITNLSEQEIENKILNGQLVYMQDMEFKEYLSKYDVNLYKLLKKSYVYETTGFVLTILGIATLSGGITSLLYLDASISVPFMLSGVAFMLPGIPLWVVGSNIHNKKIPSLYSAKYAPKNYSSISLTLGSTSTGIGLQLRF